MDRWSKIICVLWQLEGHKVGGTVTSYVVHLSNKTFEQNDEQSSSMRLIGGFTALIEKQNSVTITHFVLWITYWCSVMLIFPN